MAFGGGVPAAEVLTCVEMGDSGDRVGEGAVAQPDVPDKTNKVLNSTSTKVFLGIILSVYQVRIRLKSKP